MMGVVEYRVLVGLMLWKWCVRKVVDSQEAACVLMMLVLQ